MSRSTDLAARLDRILTEARELVDDLRVARDAADGYRKPSLRYPLRHVERAVESLEKVRL